MKKKIAFLDGIYELDGCIIVRYLQIRNMIQEINTEKKLVVGNNNSNVFNT